MTRSAMMSVGIAIVATSYMLFGCSSHHAACNTQSTMEPYQKFYTEESLSILDSGEQERILSEQYLSQQLLENH